jgi:hypothetical protein
MVRALAEPDELDVGSFPAVTTPTSSTSISRVITVAVSYVSGCAEHGQPTARSRRRRS